jgi:hypothetical protein
MRRSVWLVVGIVAMTIGAFAGVAKASESDYMYLHVSAATATAGSTVTATVTLTVGATAGGSPITSAPVNFDVYSGDFCNDGSLVETGTRTTNGSGQAQTIYLTGAGSSLVPGEYSEMTTYAGSDSYASVSVCVTFAVAQAVPTISQTVQHQDLSASDRPSITSTATVAGNRPSGSVTFAFFANTTCSGSPASTKTASLSNGTVSQIYTPPSAGGYGVTAAYGGDVNNASASSGCAESTIADTTPPPATTTTTTTTTTSPSPTTTTTSPSPTPSVVAVNEEEPMRWLAAGDSYSSGEGLPHTQGSCARPKPDSDS